MSIKASARRSARKVMQGGRAQDKKKKTVAAEVQPAVESAPKVWRAPQHSATTRICS